MLRKPAFRVESVILTRTANSFCLKATSKLYICLRYICFQQCIRSFVYSFTRLFMFSSTHAFIHVIVQTCIHLLHYSIRSIMHVFIHSWIRLSHYSLLAFNQQFVNYVCSFVRSFTSHLAEPFLTGNTQTILYEGLNCHVTKLYQCQRKQQHIFTETL